MRIRVKKKGTTFLEIVLALSIIGIISVAVFNNIYFSLKQNKLAERRQQESIIQQMVIEEIKALGNDDFVSMLKSLDGVSESSYGFIGSELIEIRDNTTKTLLSEGAERVDQFKIYQKRGTDTYIKIYFDNFTRGSANLGVDKAYGVSGTEADTIQDWKRLDQCVLVFILDKKTVAGVTTYSFEITGTNRNVQIKYEGLSIFDIEGIIKMRDTGELLVKNLRKADKNLMVSDSEIDIFIKNITEKNVGFKILNESDKLMNIYVEQEIKNNTEGQVLFTTYGDNVKFFVNDSISNPEAERIISPSLCRFQVTLFEFSNGNFQKHSNISGYKKFKRFDI